MTLEQPPINHYEIIISLTSTETVYLLFIGDYDFFIEALLTNKSSLVIFPLSVIACK